jgi:hypothetical protein
MSFATFSPLPKPQPNPIPGLPALEAAIRRLEATILTSPRPSPQVERAGVRSAARRLAVPAGARSGRW